MAKMTTLQMASALIAAVLAFRQKWEADMAEQEADRALMSEEQRQATVDTILSDELEEQDWWDYFITEVENKGLSHFLQDHANPDIACFAALNKGEPSFTLRGQDAFSSILVKHWAELARGLSPDVRARKLDGAEAIADAMEDYQPQKLPD